MYVLFEGVGARVLGELRPGERSRCCRFGRKRCCQGGRPPVGRHRGERHAAEAGPRGVCGRLEADLRRRRAGAFGPHPAAEVPDRRLPVNLQRGPRRYANPVLIGAATVLIAIVAVFLAYNANNGLPFVPRYTLNVQVRDAQELSFGTEVHLGGALVGHIVGVDPARDASGQPIAVLKLALNKSIQPLPANSTDRKSVVEGKSVALGSRRGIVKKEMYVSC